MNDRSGKRGHTFSRWAAGFGLFGLICGLVTGAGTVAATAAEDGRIHTGGETGAYFSKFCPVLKAQLEALGFAYTCEASEGTAANMARVAAKASDLGYGQLDVLTLEAARFGGTKTFARLRTDDVRECVFAVTRDKSLENYAQVAVFSSQLTFHLPPKRSGSTGTFQFLQQIDPEGLGQATAVTLHATTDDAIRKALETDNGVAFFVQFPDPDNARFKMIEELGGHVVPVIDRRILRQEVDGQKVYFAQETQVTNTRWLKAGRTVVTACTPLVVFTGQDKAIKDEALRARHTQMIAGVRGLKGDDLLPAEGLFTRILKRTKQLSAAGTERIVELSEQARERARPLVEHAKEAGKRSGTTHGVVGAPPAESGAQAFEKAKEQAKDVIAPSAKPTDPKPQH